MLQARTGFTTLTDEQLLISSIKDGDTMTSELWKGVMKAIKDTVNNNASAASGSLATPVAIVIWPTDSGITSEEGYKWAQDNPAEKLFTCTIAKTAIEKPLGSIIQAYFYNMQGTAIDCNYQQDEDYIYIYSRVDSEITVIIR